jgi:hypothetical protein
MVTILVLLAALAMLLWVSWRGTDEGAQPVNPGAAEPAGPPEFALLSVSGAGHPLVGVFGGTDAKVFYQLLPPRVTLVQPGQGEVALGRLAIQPALAQQVGVSNALGLWIEHFGVIGLDGLVEIIDRAGGLEVDLPATYSLTQRTIGPGVERLSGSEVEEFLTAEEGDELGRWGLVLGALLSSPPEIEAEDFLEIDDVEAMRDVWAGGPRAERIGFPTEQAAGATRLPRVETIDAMMKDHFGTNSPVPVVVENGSGVPGVGEDVARLILREGFRVVFSKNAESFDQAVTLIVAEDHESIPTARRVRRMLGVGRVAVSQVPSGVGDITIVVGKDFTA